VRESELPVVAIGGINLTNLEPVLKCRPAGIAIVRAAFEKGDPEKNVSLLRRKIENFRALGE